MIDIPLIYNYLRIKLFLMSFKHFIFIRLVVSSNIKSIRQNTVNISQILLKTTRFPANSVKNLLAIG
jgi:hypothetical protein